MTFLRKAKAAPYSLFFTRIFLIDAVMAGTLRSRPCARVPSTFAASHLFQPAR